MSVHDRWNTQQHLIVRSAKLACALPTFQLSKHSRLFVLTPLSKPDTVHLELEERVKLGSLLTHGIAKQAALVWLHKDLDERWRTRLMQLLYRRVGVISALLASWEYTVAARAPTIQVPLAKIADLLTTLSWLGNFVANNPDVRRELEWQNGILSRPCGSSPLTYTQSDWPEVTAALTNLASDGELFIVEELIVNAFRHGAPGKAVRFDIRKADRPDRLHLVVSNSITSSAQNKESRAYGGQSLIAEACRQGGWELLPPTVKNGMYEVRVSVPYKREANHVELARSKSAATVDGIAAADSVH